MLICAIEGMVQRNGVVAVVFVVIVVVVVRLLASAVKGNNYSVRACVCVSMFCACISMRSALCSGTIFVRFILNFIKINTDCQKALLDCSMPSISNVDVYIVGLIRNFIFF